MTHKVFAETLATKFNEVRALRDENGTVVAAGPTLSTTLKVLSIPIGAEWLSLTPRNFVGCATVRYALTPRLTVVVTTDALATSGVHGGPRNLGSGEPTDIANFPTQEISDEMQDGDAESFAVDSLGTLSDGDAIYIGAPLPFRGVSVVIGSASAQANTLTVSHIASGEAWTAMSGFTDNTDTGASLAASGTVVWTVPDPWVRTSLIAHGDTTIKEPWAMANLYWTRWEWDVALDSDTDLRNLRALSRSTDYATLLEGQPFEMSIDPTEVASVEILTDAGTANILGNAGVLATSTTGRFKRFKTI